MAARVFRMKTTDDRADVVLQAVEALSAGRVIAAPTETVYGLAALATNADAVERLLAAKNRPDDAPLALAVRSLDHARDYAPGMSPLADRLARRCWPGPVTLVVDVAGDETSLVHRLPESVQRATVPSGSVGLRVVAHSVIPDILQYVAGPLVLTSANLSGAADPTTADEVLEQLGNAIDVVLDDGPCRYGQPSTVVRVDGNDFKILREGVVGRATIERLASMMILMVCTGNTCRSPMAEALMRKHLAKRIGCKDDELERHGVIVASAGIATGAGGRPAAEAVEVLKQQGLSLNGHLTQPVTESLIQNADLVLTMTRGHRDAIVGQWPSAAARTELVRQDQHDICDPIGGPISMYRDCAEQLDRELERRAEQLAI